MKLAIIVSVVLLVQGTASFKLSKKSSLREECGVPNINNQTVNGIIIGGDEATPHTYPWMAPLINSGQFYCGSALLSDEWAITAAHCVEGGGNFAIWLGSHNINAGSETNRVEAEVAKTISHPGYSFPHNDYALLQLKEKVEFNEFIRPICLPNKKEQQDPFFGEQVLGIGWGQADNANGQDGLRQVELTTLKESEQVTYCDDTYPSVLCINTEGGSVGVCYGDSGSPLLSQRDNGQYITVGAASFVTDGSCQGATPSGYARVTHVLDWISENTGIEIEPGY